jgi:hypothetical protein
MTEEWIEAFEAQLSVKGFEEKLKRYARVRARMVAHAGRRVDELYARELVQDAIDDTLEGIIAWDPGRVSLEKHLLDAIRSRSRHDFVQATKFRHSCVDEHARIDDSTLERVDLASVTGRVLTALRAVGDPDVLRLLDAYIQGATKKVDVMRVSGLTSKRYEAARKRLNRLVLQLPIEVRDIIRA